MRKPALFAMLSVLPILTACINDSIGMRIGGPKHSVTLVREQLRFWEKKMALSIIVSRLPDCQRGYKLRPAMISPNFKVLVYMNGPDSFMLEQGKNLYAVDVQSCGNFAYLDEEPSGGKGELVGVFREEQGMLKFIAEPPSDGNPPPKKLAPKN